MKFITKMYLQLFRRNKFESNTYRASVTGRLAKKKKGKCTVIHMNFSFHSLLFHYSHDTRVCRFIAQPHFLIPLSGHLYKYFLIGLCFYSTCFEERTEGMVLNLKEDLHLINTTFSCGKDVFEERRYSLLLGTARKQYC